VFKQSFYIIFIQIVGVILGFVSIYFVAGDMGPEIYSLVGVHGVVAGVVLTFSHLGVETTMMREALYWMEHGDIEKVKEYTTQSIISRFIGFIILLPFIVGYLIYLYYTKYQCQYLVILLSFYIGSCASALTDSMSLIVRSQGDYVFSQAVKTANNSIVRFLAIFVYISYGASPYLYFYCLIPIPLLLVFYYKIKKYLSWDYVHLSGTLKKIKDSRNLWLKSYMDYFSNSADSLLVSVLFSPVVMGIFTIYKGFEGMVKAFIEGFFDVIFQRFVKYKGNIQTLMLMERKSNITRWVVIILIVVLTIVFSFNPHFYIRLFNLSKYDYIVQVIYTLAIVSVLYLVGKNEGNLIALLGPSSIILKIGVVLFIATIVSYVMVVVVPSIYGVLLQRIFIFSFCSILSIFIYKKYRMEYFSNIYQ
jgi:O-antigen/teichoic acid export membrane protein